MINGQTYKYASHVHVDSNGVHKTHFNHDDLILHQEGKEILLSDFSIFSDQICLLVLALKPEVMSSSSIEPYGRF